MRTFRCLLATLLAAASADVSAVVNHKLNAALAGGKGDVSGASRFVDNPFRISPDSRYVVYLANQDREDAYELYSVPIAGGTPTRLNGDLPAGGNVSGADAEVDHPFRISPDSRRVIYLADQEDDEVFELWSVPITGGRATRLNRRLPRGGDVSGTDARAHNPFLISPDGRFVVYVADGDDDEIFELWSVPIDGGEVRKLNSRLTEGGDVSGADPAHCQPFLISPDSRRVVYVADQKADGVFELWSVPIDGGEAVRLNGRLAAGGGVHPGLPHPFRISPDSRRVVYVADQDEDEIFELWSVPITGGETVKLNGRMTGGGDVRGADEEAVDAFLISPDSRRVVYLADQDEDEVFELWSVPIRGGEAVKLNPPLAGGQGDVSGASPRVGHPFRISPDGQRVVYVADQEVRSVFELWSVPIVGGTSTKLHPPLAGGRGDVRGAEAAMINPFLISPDSQRVVYIADQETRNVFELWSVPLVGGRSVKLNPLLAGGRGQIRGADNVVAHPFRVTPDSRRVVYVADQEIVGVMELYSVPITGGPVTKLNPTLADEQGALVGADYEVHNPFLVSADGRWTAYIGDQETDEVIELFASRLSGINVQGNAVDVVDGEYVPQEADGTDFGEVAVDGGGVSTTFTIDNPGSDPLGLGDRAVSLAGEHAGDFTVSAQPDASVPAGGRTSFTVTFDPRTAGERRAKISVAHDHGPRPYVFAIRGTGSSGR